MQNTVIEYRVKSTRFGSIKKQAKEDMQLLDDSRQQFEINYLDTFDWRAYAKQAILERLKFAHGEILAWRKLRTRTLQYKTAISGRAVFAADLPDGGLKRFLSKVLDVRALMPLATVSVNRHTLVKRNEDDKILIRIHFDEYRVFDQKTNKFRSFDKRIILAPLRGYTVALDEAKNYFSREPASIEADADIALSVLQFNGHRPGDYTSKSVVPLDANWRADKAMQLLLQKLFNIMTANEEGICQQLDTEFLHDYRIAVRKTRSLFKQLDGVFEARSILRLNRTLQWLGGMSGLARDMDVCLLQFDDFRRLLPDYMGNSIEPLRAILQKRQQQDYQQLIRALRSKRYAQFKETYTDFLRQAVKQQTSLRYAASSVKSFADTKIWKTFKKTRKEGDALRDDSPEEQLHKLRRTCKKLRYLMEAFQTLYELGLLKRLIKRLKKLQDNLGKYNDLHVQIVTLRDLFAEYESNNPLSDETRLALSDLVLHLDYERKKMREEFAICYAEFSADNIKILFRTLFKQPKPGNAL